MVSFNGHPVILKRSRRKSISLQVQPGGVICISAPLRLPEYVIADFLREKSGWIESRLAKTNDVWTAAENTPLTAADLEKLKQNAKREFPALAAYYAEKMGVTYGKISIRSQKGRWGSCSGSGNLSFNCLLMLAPDYVREYVVVHELAHRKQMNHSPAFWNEVARMMPDYRRGMCWLKDNGSLLIARMECGRRAKKIHALISS